MNRTLAALAALTLFLPASPIIGQTPALRIVVVEGEDAVNVVSQKSAVAPIVEVRDRNGQPVAGAVVKFAISKGRAMFNGARALSVTTNAAGRAVASGLTPTGSGVLNISAAASFQGQTVAITIAQTNVMTAAAATGTAAGGTGAGAGAGASASGAGAAASGAGAGAGAAAAGGGGAAAAGGAGAAAGVGGGLSATTIGIIGGAAAGGAIAAKQVLAGPQEQDSSFYTGSYSGSVNVVFIASRSFCTRTMAHSGTVDVDIVVNADGTVTGVGSAAGTMQMASFSGAQICAINPAPQQHGNQGPMSGTTSAMAWTASHGNLTTTVTYEFTGALKGDTVVGTFIFTMNDTDGVGRGVFPVTLTKAPN